jgi:hypothetical protein
MTEMLVARGARVNRRDDRGRTPMLSALHAARESGTGGAAWLGVLRTLRAAGADSLLSDNDGVNALLLAESFDGTIGQRIQNIVDPTPDEAVWVEPDHDLPVVWPTNAAFRAQEVRGSVEEDLTGPGFVSDDELGLAVPPAVQSQSDLPEANALPDVTADDQPDPELAPLPSP